MPRLPTLNKNIKLILNYVVGPLVFCLLAWSIYNQIQRQPNWNESINRIIDAFDSGAWLNLFLVMLLMIGNWGIEARKWQVALRPLHRISLFASIKAIFTGTTLAFFTPNRMGEYFGRMLYLDKEYRVKSISVTIVCSMAQLLVTLVLGCIGLIYIRRATIAGNLDDNSLLWLNLLFFLLAAGTTLLIIFFFRLRIFILFLEKIPALRRLVPYIHVLESFNATILLRLLSLSLARYTVFLLQYFLLFKAFSVEIAWWENVWSMSVVFLVLAIVPSIALVTELGVRWKASIELVQMFSPNLVGILATSLTVWVINLVIPALIGSLLILGLRFFTLEEAKSPGVLTDRQQST